MDSGQGIELQGLETLARKRRYSDLAKAIAQADPSPEPGVADGSDVLDALLGGEGLASDEARTALASKLHRLERHALSLRLLKSVSPSGLLHNRSALSVMMRASKELQDWDAYAMALWHLSDFEPTTCNKNLLKLLFLYHNLGHQTRALAIARLYVDGLLPDLLRCWELGEDGLDPEARDRLARMPELLRTGFAPYMAVLVPAVLDSLAFRAPLVFRAPESGSRRQPNPADAVLLELLALTADAATEVAQWQSIVEFLETNLPLEGLDKKAVFEVIRIGTACALSAGMAESARSWLLTLPTIDPEFMDTASVLLSYLKTGKGALADDVMWPQHLPDDLLGFVPAAQRGAFLIWLCKVGPARRPEHADWLQAQWSRVPEGNQLELLNMLIASDQLDLARSFVGHVSDAILEASLKQKQLTQVFRRAIDGWKLYGAEMLFDAIIARADLGLTNLLAGAEIKGLLGKHDEARRLLARLPDEEQTQTGVVRVHSRLGLAGPLERIAADAEARAEALLEEQDSKKLVNVVTTLIELGRIERSEQLLTRFVAKGNMRKRTLMTTKSEPIDIALYQWSARTKELLDDYDGAINAYRLYAMLGSRDEHYLAGMARCLFMQGVHERAMELIDLQASRATEDGRRKFHHVAYHIHLTRGEFDRAFEGYRYRGVSTDLRNLVGEQVYPEPAAQGDHAGGAGRQHLFLSEFGPGDELRFASLYDELSHSTGQATITCDPRLEPILKHSFPAIEFIPVRRWRREMINELGPGDYPARDKVGRISLAMLMDNTIIDALPRFDRVSLVLDELHTHRRTRQDFHRRPYLRIDPAVQDHWQRRIAERAQGRIVVGLSWRSMLQSSARSVFYTGIEDWRALFARPDVMVVSLQPGARPDEIALAEAAGGIEVFGDLDLKDDFMGVGAVMRACDIVYAPATTALELAGAVGANGVLLSMNEYTRWRLQPDGRDIWHGSVTVRHRPASQRAGAFVADLCRELDRDSLRRMQAPLGRSGAGDG